MAEAVYKTPSFGHQPNRPADINIKGGAGRIENIYICTKGEGESDQSRAWKKCFAGRDFEDGGNSVDGVACGFWWRLVDGGMLP